MSVPATVLSVLFTGLVLWLLDIDLAPAFAVGLLVLLLDVPPVTYVLSVAAASALVAGAFLGWQRLVYDRRAEQLYAVAGDGGNVLVPVRPDDGDAVARFGARVAAGDESSKLLLTGVAGADADADLEDRLARLATTLEDDVGVSCGVVGRESTGGEWSTDVRRLARDENCDPIVVPYETREDELAPSLKRLFRSNVDVIAVRLSGTETRWSRALVTVDRAGRIAHAMIAYARRLSGESGRISICTCIGDESERRAAETMCASLAEAFAGRFETRVANDRLESFLQANGPGYDLVWIGASTDRTRASRFLSPPTFRRIQDIDVDFAVVHRG